MAGTVYEDFKSQARKGSTDVDKKYNLQLLLGIVKNQTGVVEAPFPGKTAYLLFSKGKLDRGRLVLRVTDDQKGGFTATMLPPRDDGTVADKGQDFFGDVTKEYDFMKSLELAFSL